MGYYRNGRFNLSVSLRYAPAAQEINFLCQLFQQVSKILYDATDGQQYIGYVQIASNSLGGNDADIWIHPNDDVWPNSTSARLWFPAESLDISQDYTYYATVLAHELSHYLYDIRDEYNNGSSCVNDITTQASMMEGYSWDNYTRWTDSAGNNYATFADFFADFIASAAVLHAGHPSEYCHDGNHNATANNNQNNINGNQSCWTYMGNNANHGNLPYNLVVPGAGGPNLANPSPNPPAAVCVELIPAQRYMLVLDRSGSMAGNKIEQLKSGAHFWVDYVHLNEFLGLVQFSNTPTLASAMSEVPSNAGTQTTWRNDRHNIVDGLTASGATAIGDALRMALTEILSAGSAADQVIILFTDGLQNTGTETAEEVVPDAVAAGVKIYTIGLGADQDVALLTSIATTTGGAYFGIPADIPDADASDAISDALAQVSGHSRSNSAIKSFQEVDGSNAATAIDPLTLNSFAFLWPEKRSSSNRRSAGDSFKFPVVITEGSTNCTLGVKWYNPQLNYRIRVTDPSGTVISPGANARLVAGKHPYTFFDVNNPMPGTWQVEVFGNIAASRFRTVGFEVQPKIRFEVNARNYHIKSGEPILLRAKLLYGYALPGVSFQANVRTPSGALQKIKFYENKGKKGETEEEKVYTAIVKTKKSEQGQYTITVVALYKDKEFVFEPDEFYSKKPKAGKKSKRIKTPVIYRQKTICVQADRRGNCTCDEKNPLITGFNTKDPWVHPEQQELLKRWKDSHKSRKNAVAG